MRRPLSLLGPLLVLGLAGRAQAAVSDPLFTESTLVSANLGGVTGMAWAPDGSDRLFVTVKSGAVRIIAGGQLLAEPFFTFPQVYTNSECGLIGMVFDPDFGTSGRVYFFVTVASNKQQIVRLTAAGNAGTAPTVVIDNLPTAGNNHDGGALGFGPDGKLHWGIGDLGNGTGVDADLTSLAAKIGRANVSGTPASDNPFVDGVGPNNEYIWARGFRNPFTMAQQPSTGRLWVSSVGTSYEQVFIPQTRSHAGYNDYEINQPAGNDYLRPALWYRTNGVHTRTLTAGGSARSGGVITFTSSTQHLLVKGQKVTVSGVSAASLNGTFHVASVPTPTTFTVASPGPDVSGGGGTVATDNLGGSIVGGAFWESSALPAAYRGNYFFGDYNSGNLVRVQVDAGGDPSAVDVWGSGMASFIDTDVGPDGDLYTVTYNATVRRIRPKASAQGLVVTPLHRWMKEGGVSVVTVRLAQAPAAPVTVTATRTAGDADVTVTGGSALTFTPDNWQTPQVVQLGAAFDADAAPELATVTLASDGLTSENVTVHVYDDNTPALVVSQAQLPVTEGGTATFQVTLSGPPSSPVTVAVAPSGGDGDVTVASGGSLTFTSQNWSTPQTVTVAAAEDDDLTSDAATLSLTGVNLVPRTVSVTVIDNDASAPVITTTPALTAVVNVPYVYDVDATGIPTPTYAASASAAGASIDAASGLFTFTSAQPGTVDVTVTATNGIAPAAAQAFQVTVKADQAPTCVLTRPTEGATLAGATEEFFGDGADDVGTTKAEFFVDGQLGSTDTNTTGHYHFGGEHLKFDTTGLPDGPHTLRMTVTDTIGQACSVEVNVTVANQSGQGGSAGSSGAGGAAGGAGAAGEAGSGGQASDGGAAGVGGQAGDSGQAGAPAGASGAAGSPAGGQGGGGAAGQGGAGVSGSSGQASGGTAGSAGQGGPSGSSGQPGKAGASGKGGAGGAAGQGGAGAAGGPATDDGGDDGCGCRTAGRGERAGASGGWLAALGLLAGLGRRRRPGQPR